MTYYQVYNITDQDNRVVYVGVTRSSKGYIVRFKEHCLEAITFGDRGKGGLLHRHMYEEGIDKFNVHLIESDVLDTDIQDRERYYIKYYNTYYKDCPYGYNMTHGGHGVVGYEFTDEVRKKMSEGTRKKWQYYREHPDELAARNKKVSETQKGRQFTEQHRKNISDSRKGKFTGSDNPFHGKHHNETTKHKLSESNGRSVVMLDIETSEPLKEFISALEATRFLISTGATKNKFANARILDVCSGLGKTAYGYKWKFK